MVRAANYYIILMHLLIPPIDYIALDIQLISAKDIFGVHIS